MKVTLFALSSIALLLSSCAHHKPSTTASSAGEFGGGTPPEGYVFGEDEDPLDFTENGNYPNLLDDDAWAQIDERYEGGSAPVSSPARSSKPTVVARSAPRPTAAPKRPSPQVVVKSTPKPKPTPKPAPAPAPKPPQPTYHVVVKGDTLWGLSRRFGTRVDEIQAANRLPSQTISIGQRLMIPKPGTVAVAKPSAPAPAPARVSVAKATHVVKRGETLWRIGQTYGVDIASIQAANNLAGNLVRPGDHLRIP